MATTPAKKAAAPAPKEKVEATEDEAYYSPSYLAAMKGEQVVFPMPVEDQLPGASKE